MSDHLEILESAISDVGYWQWWCTDLPRAVQLEFGGAQLWSPPVSPDKPPSGQVALRLIEPQTAIFLTAPDTDLPRDWHELMQRDELQPPTLSCERFTLSSFERASEFLALAADKHVLVGSPDVAKPQPADCIISFWAGNVGFFGIGKGLKVFNIEGELSPDGIRSANHQWWEYWKRYWQQKDGPTPMPKDYACEVTIPLK